jgi:hypothetical protein
LVHTHLAAPILLWHLERYIPLDSDSHGRLAEHMVMELCHHQRSKLDEVNALQSHLEHDRATFWREVAQVLEATSRLAPSSSAHKHLSFANRLGECVKSADTIG